MGDFLQTRISQIPATATWPLRHTVMWPDKPLDYIKLSGDDLGIHYGLFVEKQLVSVVSLFIDDDVAQFRKFATATSEQGKGYGTRLLSHLITEAKHKDIKLLWCNARVDKAAYYERFGMKKTCQIFNKGGIDYVIMEHRF